MITSSGSNFSSAITLKKLHVMSAAGMSSMSTAEMADTGSSSISSLIGMAAALPHYGW
jgi:hypothetical protein